MAEYITKEQAFELLDDGDMYARKALTEMKSVDVVEREKINKAIENIKQDMIEHSGTGEEVIQAYCDGLEKALEYLENIGE